MYWANFFLAPLSTRDSSHAEICVCVFELACCACIMEYWYQARARS